MQSSIEVERAVIGAMVIDDGVIDEISTILAPGDFYSPMMGKVYQAIVDLHSAGKAVDLITIDQEIHRRGYTEPSAADLAEWADGVMVSAAPTYAASVKKLAIRRAMTRTFQDGLVKLNELGEEPKEVAEEVATKILQLGSEQRRQFVSVGEIAVSVLKSIERAATEGGLREAVPSGIANLDRKIGGLFRGQLIVIAGRTSMGKTAIAMNMVKGAARRGYTAGVVSCETPSSSIVMRMISAGSGIENRDLRRGNLVDRDYPRITFATGQISKLPIYLHDRERQWEAIKSALRTLKIQQPDLSLVVVDYVQLLRLRSREDRWQQVGQISAESKDLALELDLPLVLLSQISRDVERRQDKRPTMADLRESGNLEQDADVIGLLFRPHYYDESAPADAAELNIAKNRDGATGVIDLAFDEKTTTFFDPADNDEPQESFL